MSSTQLQDRSTNPLSDADADLLLRLRIALSIHKRAGWHLVRFTARDGIVQLTGVVPSYYDRQLIASLVRHVAGVFGIEDQLTVGDPSIRQQVVNLGKTVPTSSTATTVPLGNSFLNLHTVAGSLDNILVGT